MDTGLLVALIVAVVIVALIVILVVAVLLPRRRRSHLRERFGPEYDRAVEEHGGRRDAERELARREKRHSRLDLRPLTPRAREEYSRGWAAIQERFVDSPIEAVREADDLVSRLMVERGYPTEGEEQRLADLSVEHSAAMQDYRAAREVRARVDRGDAPTEELREAMVRYRSLFADLLDEGSGENRGAG
ncbi:hypothetical protein SAMN02745673_00197 [Marinactinospora thermotolerans DSM 45154]|uniref:Secreted protein n=1 Tax=Marinactinospora thermotolerans DSM 45154 TaxID=1122192 RepID=A0A1T4K6X8_9ACTN|nr:hypothetical protein [Marinactinospora thermotolerans]SJZ38184.1 hypothetical protein SAMN02745673_00197 [Marinactinospora thermotolerans DSM 45154]